MPVYEISFLLILLFFLFAMGMPIAFVLTAVGVVGILFQSGVPGLYQFAWQFWEKGGNFLYTCIPLFIYMAIILEKGKVGNYIYDVAAKWLRRLPGGLGISTIAAAAIFSALSGTSVATAATMGIISAWFPKTPPCTRR